jgi:hypothetical protein
MITTCLLTSNNNNHDDDAAPTTSAHVDCGELCAWWVGTCAQMMLCSTCRRRRYCVLACQSRTVPTPSALAHCCTPMGILSYLRHRRRRHNVGVVAIDRLVPKRAALATSNSRGARALAVNCALDAFGCGCCNHGSGARTPHTRHSHLLTRSTVALLCCQSENDCHRSRRYVFVVLFTNYFTVTIANEWQCKILCHSFTDGHQPDNADIA